jgi:CO/xanthine dehydrogenase Mo-binding subunit
MTEKGFKYVGKNMPLHDAAFKVTGEVKYAADMRMPGMLYAKLLLSPLPHARIKKIHKDNALSLPGVWGVYCHENSPAALYNSQQWFTGQENINDEKIFSDTARFVGDRIAAVVAEDMETAEKALSLLEVEYEELPAIYDAEESFSVLKPLFQKEVSCGEPEEAFKRAHKVVEDRVETQKIHHAALEPHVCMAYLDHTRTLTVVSPCQQAFSVRIVLASVLGMPHNKIRIIKPPMGGSFGGKQEVILEPVTGFLALKTGRPVMIQMNRREAIMATRTRTKTIGYVRTAVDEDGKILARDADIISDVGAYTSNGVSISMAILKKLSRLYNIENQHSRVSSVYTNTPVAGAARGYGGPQVHTITETNMDHTALALGMDPVDFRLKNLVHPYALDPMGGPPLGNAQIIACLRKGAEEFNWQDKRKVPPGGGRIKYGVGVACASHNNGIFGGGQEFAAMNLRMLDDGSVLLNACLHELGCGTITTMQQIVAEVLDLSPSKIEVPEVDTHRSPYDIGSTASRVTFVCGKSALQAALKLKSLLQQEAALILKCRPEDVFMQEEKIWSGQHPDRKFSYGEMAALIQDSSNMELSVTENYVAQANPSSYGVNFCAVEVDTLTGLVKVVEVVAVHDLGQAINPALVEGQVYGGIQMGLGMALTEEIQIDGTTGVPKSDNFGNYHILNAPDMPPVRVFLIEEGEVEGPYGAKSIGEICTVPITAAVVNAVNHALGTRITTLPLTPERIVAALSSKGPGR